MKDYKVVAWSWCADYCKKNQWNPHDSYFWDKAMLEYRREHNIYEIDDYVVYQGDAGLSGLFRIEKLTKTGKPKSVKSSRFGGFPCRYCEVRHATDAEIKAGKRL